MAGNSKESCRKVTGCDNELSLRKDSNAFHGERSAFVSGDIFGFLSKESFILSVEVTIGRANIIIVVIGTLATKLQFSLSLISTFTYFNLRVFMFIDKLIH